MILPCKALLQVPPCGIAACKPWGGSMGALKACEEQPDTSACSRRQAQAAAGAGPVGPMQPGIRALSPSELNQR